MALFELDDVFTYQDANDIKRLWASNDAPSEPGSGEVWLDLSVSPILLKRWNGSSWDALGELTAAQLLTLIKTVDGSGCGLDADMLDGLEGSSFVRSDADDEVNGNTQWQNSQKIKLGSAADAEFYSDGSDVYLRLNKDNSRLIFKLGGTAQAAEVQSAMTGSAGAHSNHPVLRLRQTAGNNYNIGDIHSEIEFYTDDSEANFPGAQAFIRAITTRGDGISYPDAGLSFGVSYSSDTAVEAVRIDGEGNLVVMNDKSITIGQSSDILIKHDGTYSIIRNDVDNGVDFYIQNKSQGDKIIMTCENSSGTMKTLMTLDPETDRVTTKLDRSSLPDLWYDLDNASGDSPYIESGLKYGVSTAAWSTVWFNQAFTTAPRIVATPATSTTDENPTCWIYTVTTTYFKIRGSHSIKAYWMAIGSKTS